MCKVGTALHQPASVFAVHWQCSLHLLRCSMSVYACGPTLTLMTFPYWRALSLSRAMQYIKASQLEKQHSRVPGAPGASLDRYHFGLYIHLLAQGAKKAYLSRSQQPSVWFDSGGLAYVGGDNGGGCADNSSGGMNGGGSCADNSSCCDAGGGGGGDGGGGC